MATAALAQIIREVIAGTLRVQLEFPADTPDDQLSRNMREFTRGMQAVSSQAPKALRDTLQVIGNPLHAEPTLRAAAPAATPAHAPKKPLSKATRERMSLSQKKRQEELRKKASHHKKPAA